MENNIEQNEDWILPVKKEILESWLEDFGKIFKTEVDGDVFLWRRIKRSEYIAVMADDELNKMSKSEKLFKRQEIFATQSILYPNNIEQLIENSAGLATVLADEIILKSGFDIVDTEEVDING